MQTNIVLNGRLKNRIVDLLIIYRMYEKLSNFLFSELEGYSKHATLNKYSHICHE
jgi:hypothetical protein